MVIEHTVEGFAYPNEMIGWELLIVLYPFITGLVAGAFIASALYHVFNKKEVKPVANLALLLSACLLVVTSIPLLVHLTQNLRFYHLMVTPNLSSAMAGFGYIYAGYFLLVLVEIWFVYRTIFVAYAEKGEGIKKLLGKILTLGSYDVSKKAIATDHKIGYWLAVLGIPWASLLHGYVGFIFGSVKANPWWSTPLMPLIFLLSAVVSGIALLILVYVILETVKRRPIDLVVIRGLSKYLWGFMILDFVFHLIDYIYKAYTQTQSWHIIEEVMHDKLAFTYLGLEMLGGIVIIILLTIPRISTLRAVVASTLVLISVFAMRWDVVVGGQMFSKSLAGFLSYTPEIFGKEGVLVAIVILLIPFVVLTVLLYFLPWRQEDIEDIVGPSEGH